MAKANLGLRVQRRDTGSGGSSSLGWGLTLTLALIGAILLTVWSWAAGLPANAQALQPNVTLQAGPACGEVQAVLENFTQGDHTVIIWASNAPSGARFPVHFDAGSDAENQPGGSDVLVDFQPVGASKVTVEMDGISDSLTLPGCPVKPQSPPKVSTPKLPFTGANTLPETLAGCALIGIGGALLLLKTRSG